MSETLPLLSCMQSARLSILHFSAKTAAYVKFHVVTLSPCERFLRKYAKVKEN
jgi:hypothetical protein